jgi:hypothetical protein
VNNIPRAGAGNNLGPGTLFAPGFGQGNYYGPFAPYVLSTQPVVFNNRGHWYSLYYGHWYPNGLTSGIGVLSNGGNGGGYNRLVGSGSGQMAGNSAFGVSPVMGAGTPGAGLPGAGGIGPGVVQPGGGLPQGMPGAMPAMPVIGGFPR